MIRNNQIRAFWQPYPIQSVNPDTTKYANGRTPNHINRETPLFPRRPRKRDQKEWVKE